MFIATFGEMLSKAVFTKCIAYFIDPYLVRLSLKGEIKMMNTKIGILALCAVCGGMV
jgi:hypothetical protein